MIRSINSIMKVFRFHTGSIKSSDGNLNRITIEKFRFHTGSIKRKEAWQEAWQEAGFDSILVRLKAVSKMDSLGMYPSFDSILVRLKDQDEKTDAICESMFRFHTGSIKSLSTLILQRVRIAFRFHTGSIKSYG